MAGKIGIIIQPDCLVHVMLFGYGNIEVKITKNVLTLIILNVFKECSEAIFKIPGVPNAREKIPC